MNTKHDSVLVFYEVEMHQIYVYKMFMNSLQKVGDMIVPTMTNNIHNRSCDHNPMFDQKFKAHHYLKQNFLL